MPEIPHVSLDFHEMTFDDCYTLAGKNRIGIRDNPKYFDYLKTPKPPLTDIEYAALIDDAFNTHNIYTEGGRAQKPEFDKSYIRLIGGMDKFAGYVDIIADGDEGIIVLSAFNVANSRNHAGKQTFPGTPTVSAFRAETTGEIDSECEVFGRGAIYGCIISEDKPLDSATTITGKGQLCIPTGQTNKIIHVIDIHRKKKITGLTKGKNYWFYYYVANVIGVSQLSVGFEIMCA